MTEYKDKLNSFASRLKTESAQIQIQEVKPVDKFSKAMESETQLNIWIPKSLMKKLKKYSVDKELTLKEAVINSIVKLIGNFEETN
jgi:hypothetical protein